MIKEHNETKEEMGTPGKEIYHLPLFPRPLMTFCLHVTRSKLVSHANPAVKEFVLSFESHEIFFIVTFLKNMFAIACTRRTSSLPFNSSGITIPSIMILSTCLGLIDTLRVKQIFNK